MINLDEITRKNEVDEERSTFDLVDRSLELGKEKRNSVFPKVLYSILVVFIGISIIVLIGLFVSGFRNKDPLISKYKTYEKPTIEKSYFGEPFIINKAGIGYEILPLAEYRIFGRMVAKNRYPDDFDLAIPIAPYDIGIAHGKLAMHSSLELFNFGFGDRCLIYSYYIEEHPFTTEYMQEHLDNVHAIHANDKILEAIEKVEDGQFIILEGNLVNVDIVVKATGEKAIWESSLVHGTDECKVMYITKVILGKEVYE